MREHGGGWFKRDRSEVVQTAFLPLAFVGFGFVGSLVTHFMEQASSIHPVVMGVGIVGFVCSAAGIGAVLGGSMRALHRKLEAVEKRLEAIESNINGKLR